MEEEEIFYALTGQDTSNHLWQPVDQQFFIRTADPTVCGPDADTIIKLIAAYEKVPVIAIWTEWHGGSRKHSYKVGGGELEALPYLLEYTQRTHRLTPYNGPINAYHAGRLLKLEAVNVNKNRRKYHWGLVIDKKWVIEGHWITYDPKHAAQLLSDEPTKMSFSGQQVKTPKSKIPCTGVLWPMVNELLNRIDDVYPFNEVYPKRRYHQSIAHVRRPNTLKEIIQAIPALLALYALLIGDLRYRTKRWKDSVKVLLKEHMTDVAMTKDLQRLVTREYAHRQPWEIENEEKGKRKKRSAAAP